VASRSRPGRARCAAAGGARRIVGASGRERQAEPKGTQAEPTTVGESQEADGASFGLFCGRRGVQDEAQLAPGAARVRCRTGVFRLRRGLDGELALWKGDAIAGGFVYRGKKWPSLQGSLVFGDITSGRIFYARMTDLYAAADGNPATLAAYTEIKTDLASIVLKRARDRTPSRPSTDVSLVGATASGNPSTVSAPPFRVDMRLAVDSDGEIYVLTKSDGMIRRVESIE